MDKIAEETTSVQKNKLKEPNAKRGRIATMIKEKESKRPKTQIISVQNITSTDTTLTFPPQILSTSDHRYYLSKIIMAAMNSCDVLRLTECYRQYCTPDDLIYTISYEGDPDDNPIGSPSRTFIGIESIAAIFGMWFKISPDNTYMPTSHSAMYDKNTGIITSTTHCTWTFTHVIHLDPVVSDEEIQSQERLKSELMKKNARNDKKTLETVQKSLRHTVQYREDTTRSGSSEGGSDWNTSEIDSFLDSVELIDCEDNLLYSFNGSQDVDDAAAAVSGVDVDVTNNNANTNNTYTSVADSGGTNSNCSSSNNGTKIENSITFENLFNYETLQNTVLNNTTSNRPRSISIDDTTSNNKPQHATIQQAIASVLAKPVMVKKESVRTCSFECVFDVEIDKEGKVCKMLFNFHK